LKREKVRIDDFKLNYKFDECTTSCSTYYISNGNFYEIIGRFDVFNFDYMNIVDKLNFENFLKNIFKKEVLSKLIGEVDDIQPAKMENIPNDARIYKLYPNLIFSTKQSATEKYCNRICRDYLSCNNKEKLIKKASQLLDEHLASGFCDVDLEDIDYKVYYDTNNEWLTDSPYPVAEILPSDDDEQTIRFADLEI
jgi:hypothetical protein